MRISRITYGRGFTAPVGSPGTYQSARGYREITMELDPSDDVDEARQALVVLVDSDLTEDYTRLVGE